VTFDKPDTRELLADERVYHAVGPTNRHYANVARNFGLARRILANERPDILVSNGAGLALPFFLLARSYGIPFIFLEVPDRIAAPSLTGRVLYPLVDRMVLSHPQQSQLYPVGTPIVESP
jgi:UDP-N-acetylglucosamine:LPS N-acetylglucosamine transferase